MNQLRILSLLQDKQNEMHELEKNKPCDDDVYDYNAYEDDERLLDTEIRLLLKILQDD